MALNKVLTGVFPNENLKTINENFSKVVTIDEAQTIDGQKTFTTNLIGYYIQTGDDDTHYFQTKKMRGEGTAASYHHAIDFGYTNHNQVDFYEYGGIWSFWKNTTESATSDASNLALKIGINSVTNKSYVYTWPNKTGTLAIQGDFSVTSNLTSGTKIATITMNGTSTDLYCEKDTHITYSIDTGSGNSVTLTGSNGTSYTRYINQIYDMGEGTANAYRVVWFADNTNKAKPVYDTSFIYNPSAKTLSLGKIYISNLLSSTGGIWTKDSSGNQIPLIGHNDTALWIGADYTGGTHSTGKTCISAGDDTTGLMISKLVNNTRTNYYVLDAENTSFTRSLSSGTKIGTLKIGNISTDLYCTNADDLYVKKAGDTITGQIQKVGTNSSWVNGRSNAMFRTTSCASDAYSPILSIKSASGSWDLGPYTSDTLHLSYITDTNFSSGNNAQTADIAFYNNGWIGSVGLQLTNAISYKGTKATYNMIKFVDNTGDTYGNGIRIGGGGATVIGGGESADVITLESGGSERMVIANDSSIEFYSNCQDGEASAKIMTYNANGTLSIPNQLYTAKGALIGGSLTTTNGIPYIDGTKITTSYAGIAKNGIAFSNPGTNNDAAWLRVTGTGESDTVLEIATGDDGGTGETIVFRGYNTSNNAAYTVTVPKTSGTISLEGHTHSYLPLSGGVITGVLAIDVTNAGSYNEGLRINSDTGWSVINMGANKGTTSGGDTTKGMIIGRPSDSTYLIITGDGNESNDSARVRINRDGSLYTQGSQVATVNTALLKSGGTMTGALNFANATWNTVGDDVYMGDQNVSGGFCIKGANGATKLVMQQYNGSSYGYLSFDGSNFSFSKPLADLSLASSISICKGYPTYHGETGSGSNYSNGSSYLSSTGVSISQGNDESSGVQFNGDWITMWSPCDGGYSLCYYDEDNGAKVFTISASGYLSSASDISLKQDINTLEVSDEEFLSLKPKRYKWKRGYQEISDIKKSIENIQNGIFEDKIKDEYKELFEAYDNNYISLESLKGILEEYYEEKLQDAEKRADVESFGIIAQDLQEIYPNMIDDSGNILSVEYNQLHMVTLTKVQDILIRLKKLEEKIGS